MKIVINTQDVAQVFQQSPAACIFRATLPLPPGINGSYRPGRDGRSIRATPELLQFKHDAYYLLCNRDTCWCHHEALSRIKELVTGPTRQHTQLLMRTRIYTRTIWYYDIDAFGKAATDAVFRKLDMAPYDNLIVDERTTKEIDQDNNPRIEIELYCACTADEE